MIPFDEGGYCENCGAMLRESEEERADDVCDECADKIDAARNRPTDEGEDDESPRENE